LIQVFRIAVGHSRAEKLAIEQKQAPERRATQRVRLVQNRLEYGAEITGRRVDHAQHLGGRGLLLQRLAKVAVARFQFAEQPDVFDGDGGLVGEGLKKLNLRGAEGLYLAPAAANDTDRLLVPQDRNP